MRNKDIITLKGEDDIAPKGKNKKTRTCINLDFSDIAEELDGSKIGHNTTVDNGIPEEIAEITDMPIPFVFSPQKGISDNPLMPMVSIGPVTDSAEGEEEERSYTIENVSGDKVISKRWHKAAVEKLFSVTPSGVDSSSLSSKGARKEVRSTLKVDRRDKITGEVTEKYLNQRPGTWKRHSIAMKKEKAKKQLFAEVEKWDQYVIESFVYGDSVDYPERWLKSRTEQPHLEYVTDEGIVHGWNSLNGDISSHPWMTKNRKAFATDLKKLTADDTICLVSLIKIVFIKPYSILMQEVLDNCSSSSLPSPVNDDIKEEEQ